MGVVYRKKGKGVHFKGTVIYFCPLFVQIWGTWLNIH